MTALDKITLAVWKDYSPNPGPRYEVEGDHSGELFRTTCLFPKMSEAIAKNTKLVVDLDHTAGYGTSFLEEAFGGLIRENGLSYDEIKAHLELISNEEEYLIGDIEGYLADARDGKRQ